MVRRSRCALGGSGVGLLLALWAGGCASGPDPTEEDIWHESSLRPSRVAPATHGERELLARMEQVPAGEAVRFGGQVFIADAPYYAASGRACRSVTIRPRGGGEQTEVKLACEGPQGWQFVPDPFEEGPAPGPVAERAP